MLIWDEELTPQHQSICENCQALFLTRTSPATIQECVDCMRRRLEPKDEMDYDWREERWRIVEWPVIKTMEESQRRWERGNTR